MVSETAEGIRPGLEGSSNSSASLKGPFSSPHPAQGAEGINGSSATARQ